MARDADAFRAPLVVAAIVVEPVPLLLLLLSLLSEWGVVVVKL